MSEVIYYFSPELADEGLPVECVIIGNVTLVDRPEIEAAVIQLSHATKNLPKRLVIVPKSGNNLELKSLEDVVLLYVFDGTNAMPGDRFSYDDLRKTGVLDWGALSHNKERAHEWQVR